MSALIENVVIYKVATIEFHNISYKPSIIV